MLIITVMMVLIMLTINNMKKMIMVTVDFGDGDIDEEQGLG
jgi:hypothetical protein